MCARDIKGKSGWWDSLPLCLGSVLLGNPLHLGGLGLLLRFSAVNGGAPYLAGLL